ncbi:MBL fold metallo-hydrolase [Flavobacterium sp. NRK1]|uniref:MBL fold metallo-hydrolase n=1 Tax=Flavobacterium sp. NRK1 TaxID=2954929 RepID=UPI0020937BB7|nr:MBL fold metallo-hydrolase [Flavobacterium sp. NRK1]MCO6147760.1 MBL fold metallo-hydrolase [Flavobacterium sp. NRK1]
MKKRIKKIVMILGVIVVLLVVGVAIFLQSPSFGRRPSGERLKAIEQSKNYKDGQFQNLSYTPDLKEGVSYYTVFKDFFFSKSKRSKPKNVMPSQKTDLLHLDPSENVIVWFGHSSYFMQADGKTILMDPVFSGAASPISITTKAFAGSDVYTVDDLPEIDLLFISHDHWDHLDYETVLKLKGKVKKIITGLGTAEHFERWDYDTAIIEERDWNDTIDLGNGFVVNTTPARHFSGRGLKRNTALWMSFVLKTPTLNLYLGGDSGYDSHYKAIGDKFGPFDLAILECGQYNEYWKYIHMMPEEVVKAAAELKAKKLMPVHWAKFSLALHDWDEPILRLTAAAKKQNIPLVTPMIGQKASLTKNEVFTEWWLGLE